MSSDEQNQNTQPTRKWTKEYMREYQREYMRNRWRRVHSVKPENYQETRESKELEVAQKYGEGAVEFMKELKQKQKEKNKKEPIPQVKCEICHGLYMDTPGQRKMHERTRRHKLGVEIKNDEK